MTDDKTQIQSGTDELVSETYREVANERAPEHLNQAVLRRAKEATRPRLSRTRAWTRPLAWAATITLSVALVLEVSKAPSPDAVLLDNVDRAYELQKRVSETSDDLASDAPLELDEEVATAPASIALPENASAFSSTAGQSPASREAVIADLERRQEQVSQESKALQDNAAPMAEATAFKIKDDDMLRRADEMARLRSGENQELGAADAALAEADIAPSAFAARQLTESACSDIARSTAASWLECIIDLEQAGLVDEAKNQRAALLEAFPDFDPQ